MATTVYVLQNDIDCIGVDFVPIPNFSGTFRGNGHTVSNVSISSSSDYVGFFSRIGNGGGPATIENLTLANIHVTSTRYYVGLLAGKSEADVITNVTVSGTISSAIGYVGGLIGITESATVTRAQASVIINTPSAAYVGGLIGIANAGSSITRSSSGGAVIADSYIGGFIGISEDGATVNNSYSTASVSGDSFVGGLMGVSESANENLYAAGEVTATGFFGGGLIGADGPFTVTANSYWDTETTLQMTSAAGTGKTTVEMQDVSTYSGWNFSTIWYEPSVGVYPRLRPYDDTPPTAPGTPSAENPTRYPPYVTWTASTDAGVGLASQAYTIQWSTSTAFTGTVYTSTTASNTFFDVTTLADGAWYYRVSAQDVLGNTTAYATSSAIIVDAAIPVITLTGESSVSLERGAAYTDAGATASDAVQGDLTSSILATNTVNTNVVGTYTVTYSVTDAAGNVGEPVVRTVYVIFVNRGGGGGSPPVQPVAQQVDSKSGPIPLTMTVNGLALPVIRVSSPFVRLGFNADPSKVKGYAVSLRADFEGSSIYPYQSSIDYQLPVRAGTHVIYAKLYSVTGDASPVLTHTVEYAPAVSADVQMIQPTVTLSVATMSKTYQFTRNLRVGMEGEDVRELQKLLNTQGFLVAKRGNGSVGKETRYFGAATARALARFQEAHRKQLLAPLSLTRGTGFFLDVTRAFVNRGAF